MIYSFSFSSRFQPGRTVAGQPAETWEELALAQDDFAAANRLQQEHIGGDQELGL